MDFEQQLETEHLLLEDRECSVCGVTKSLLADYYRIRKNPSLKSSYSYECKSCTLQRLKTKNKKRYKFGTCCICNRANKKLVKDICVDCVSGLNNFSNSVDILENAMLYLKKNYE